MFKKIILVVAFSLVSCTQNVELVSYTVDGDTKKVMSKEVSKDIESLFEQANPQEMGYILSDPNIFKMVIQNRTFESDLIINEARQISNYQDDVVYMDAVAQKTQSLPLELAYRDGLDKISNEVIKQTVEISEVSRIFFTNQSEQVIGQILAELLASDDLITDFALKAEEHSQEMLGARTGGYLGNLVKGQFSVVDEIVFDQNFEGMYGEILTDHNGAYLILVHSPIRKVKVENFEKEGINIDIDTLMLREIESSVEYLYSVDMNDSDVIYIDGVQKNTSQIGDDEKIVKIWGKDYTFKQIADQTSILMNADIQLSTRDMFVFIAPTRSRPAVSLQKISIVEKGYDKNIENSKEYKELLAENLKNIELDTVYKIVIEDLYKDTSTNVTSVEIAEYYADVNNREVVSYKDDGTPVFATLEQSTESIKQMILSKRAEEIQIKFINKLNVDYAVTWHEENLMEFITELQKKYDKYLSDNNINMF